MKARNFVHKTLPLIGLVTALSLFALSMFSNLRFDTIEKVASDASECLEERVEILNGHIDATLNSGPNDRPITIPDDMVIYHYILDSLVSWSNQFTVLNDDITSKVVIHRLDPVYSLLHSPLADIGNELEYVNIGAKWYMAKAVKENDHHIIAGIEIKNKLIDESGNNKNGINPNLKIGKRYNIEPLTSSDGHEVKLYGKPIFKITKNRYIESVPIDNITLKIAAIVFLIITMLFFLAGHRKFRTYIATILAINLIYFITRDWISGLSGIHEIFSPQLFADEKHASLSHLILINTVLTLFAICTFIIKGRINVFLRRLTSHKKLIHVIYGVLVISITVFMSIHLIETFKSAVINSNLNLELYKIHDNYLTTAIVYLSYIGLLISIILMVQLFRPALAVLTGVRYNVLSRTALAIYAFVGALFFCTTAGYLGFEKEKGTVQIWANKLAMDRDIELEAKLINIENRIAEDNVISSLCGKVDNFGTIFYRIREFYLGDFSQKYDITIRLMNDSDIETRTIIRDLKTHSEPITKDSRFYITSDSFKKNDYVGVFTYYQKNTDACTLIIELENRTNREDRGYHRILNKFVGSDDLNIPNYYSYAKYNERMLNQYRGNYPYPTVSDIYTAEMGHDGEVHYVVSDDYVHFVVSINDSDIVVISRHERNALVYITTFIYVFFSILLIMQLVPTKKNRKQTFRSHYFRTKINIILFVSSFLILASMAIISIAFVYKKNKDNIDNMMSEKISTVQSLMEKKTQNMVSSQEMNRASIGSILDEISSTTDSDITLFAPDGKIIRSTSPEVYERFILGSRIDQEAYYNIHSRKYRHYKQQETIEDLTYWVLYAPLMNTDGEIIAIISVPYVDSDHGFEREAFFHTALIIAMFLSLLSLSLLFTTREVNSMFSPLLVMGKKMKSTDINHLEYIKYDREDEISSLVDAYNRMVKDLSHSSMELAQAERDKAWSQMARQVAHEIKNPLTPIKLEIQRLIRLKNNNNPKWEEKFDQVSTIILEHIQILSDTANEFSTFANLYDEEPVLIDLDKILHDQIAIFDNKENIEISYIGMPEAYTIAPKPQLIRVFVNLITNAIQAVENQQKEDHENGMEVKKGYVMIYLRNSTKEGYYDIAVEDNGPGVKGENLGKLFTPNFTTKTGGTGLGLAICRNIIQRCNGDITYQKSFALNGAAFIVRIPKKDKENQ